MCLTNEGREQVRRWARQQSDEGLQEYIDSQPRNGFSTLNAQINHIIHLKIEQRLTFPLAVHPPWPDGASDQALADPPSALEFNTALAQAPISA
jgi:hypothetical protein